jgi:hypothetical protein
MERREANVAGNGISAGAHYHIRWWPSGNLDWERFDSREDAHTRAYELASPGETYSLEEFQQNCTRCNPLASAANS